MTGEEYPLLAWPSLGDDDWSAKAMGGVWSGAWPLKPLLLRQSLESCTGFMVLLKINGDIRELYYNVGKQDKKGREKERKRQIPFKS